MSIRDVLNTMPQVGQVQWIGLRPARLIDMSIVQSVQVTADDGLYGDRAGGGKNKKRQVTLIQQEHLAVVAAILGMHQLSPEQLRRNIVVAGINLLALKNKQVRIGTVTLEVTGNCAPCTRMEENLGPGGYNAMRGHGGVTAQVLAGGEIKIGDTVRMIAESDDGDESQL